MNKHGHSQCPSVTVTSWKL